MKQKYIAFLLSALALAACDAEKIPITGTRIPVINYESSVKVDEETKDTFVTLPLSALGQDWPQVGGCAAHAMTNLSLQDTLAPLWTASVGAGNGEGRFLSSPVVAEGVVYTLDTYGNVSAIDATSGALLWQINIEPKGEQISIIGGGVAYGNEKLYVTSPHAEVLALNAKTGAILWRYGTPSPVRAAPTLDEGRLYILTISNQLEVLDAETGTPLWNHAGITEHAGLLGTASPAVSKGVIVVTYSSGEIYALKAENGHQLWTETLSTTRRPDSLSSLSHIKALPVISKNMALIVGHNHKMAAYDLRRGERLWERHIGGTRTPAVIGDFIFMINSHNELLCITLQHGQVVWVKKLGSDPEAVSKVIWEGPIVAGGKLYLVNMGGGLISFDPATGEVLGSRTLGGMLSLPPVVAQERLYLLTNEGDLMAFQ